MWGIIIGPFFHGVEFLRLYGKIGFHKGIFRSWPRDDGDVDGLFTFLGFDLQEWLMVVHFIQKGIYVIDICDLHSKFYRMSLDRSRFDLPMYKISTPLNHPSPLVYSPKT